MSDGKLTARDGLLRERNRLSAINARETDQKKADLQEARIQELNALLDAEPVLSSRRQNPAADGSVI
jgi:hypothetical protein